MPGSHTVRVPNSHARYLDTSGGRRPCAYPRRPAAQHDNLAPSQARGAIPSAYQIPTPVILTPAWAATLVRIRHIPQVLARRAVSPVGKETARGCKLNPMVEAEPHVVAY